MIHNLLKDDQLTLQVVGYFNRILVHQLRRGGDPSSLAFRVRDPHWSWEAFLTPTRDEFGHVHRSGFLHLMLPRPIITALRDAGWVELHPITERPDFPDTAVMFYAPRDEAELAVAVAATRASWQQATGRDVARQR